MCIRDRAWGVLYESGAIALPNFPFTFAEIPHVHIATENSNYAMFVERGSSSSWSTTVSYTHLDVYKRQPLLRADRTSSYTAAVRW